MNGQPDFVDAEAVGTKDLVDRIIVLVPPCMLDSVQKAERAHSTPSSPVG
jgi:hypothetical protein